MKRVFLGWHESVSVLSAERLLLYKKKSSLYAIDLSHLLIIVPTKQSGRLLENELLKIAESENSVLLSPEFKTPLNLLELPQNSADKINEQTSMMEALSSVDELPVLFPNGVPKENCGRFEAAKTICALRATLAERGLTINDAAQNKIIQENEPERWQDLSKLESLYKKILERRGLLDRTICLKEASLNSTVVGVDKVIIVSVPDPIPLALNAIQNIDNTVPVEIWINAPDTECDSFDEFGIPKDGSFDLLSNISDNNISLVRKPSDAAEKTIQILSEKNGLSVDDFDLSLFTDELINPLMDSFEERGYETYNPAGETCRDGVLYNLISDFLQLLIDGSYESFVSICRNPHFTESLTKIDRIQFLLDIDKFHDEILPVDSKRFYNEIIRIADDSKYIHLKSALELFPKALIKILSGDNFENSIEMLLDFLSEVYLEPKTFLSKKQEELFELKAKKISSLIFQFNEISNTLNVTESEIQRLLLSTIENTAVYAPHSADSIPLQGWLEMNWSTAPNIILVGFNEGFIPESITSDLLLPESARKALLLKNNSQRMTRDLFLMRTLVESRKDNLFIIVLKTNELGDPLKPSRLLFSCSKEKILKRANYLFGEDNSLSAKVQTISNRSELPLITPVLPTKDLDKISITSFRNYLSCPFRFYLDKILGMEHVHGDANQMDNMIFGTLCHWALEQYGKNFNGDLFNENEVKDYLKSRLEEKVTEKYGYKPVLSILLQLENAKRRLEKAAIVETQNRVDGWEIIESEYSGEFLIEGVAVTGKIDRIEYNSQLKKWRIIDFKTSSKADAPQLAHFGKDALDSDSKCLSFQSNDDKAAKLWKNLQLPLYIKLLDNTNSLHSSDGAVFSSQISNFELCYFNLPDAVSETGLYIWKDYSNLITESAYQCAREIITRIKNKQFWPPKEKIDFDSFEELHTGDIAEIIDAKFIKQEDYSNE